MKNPGGFGIFIPIAVQTTERAEQSAPMTIATLAGLQRLDFALQ